MARQLTEQLEREVSAEELMKQTKASSGKSEAAPSSAPAAFDTSYTPNTPPPAVTPPPADAPAPAPVYSPENAATVQGADWHPSPPDNKPTRE
jgi:hypothetical protein